LLLKEYFWIKLFGEKVTFSPTQVGRARLEGLYKAAIKEKAAIIAHTKAA
jgi:hypothetical protein